MKQIIAVESELTPVRDFLSSKGYQVESVHLGEITKNRAHKFDAFVVTGMDENFLGINDTITKAIVLDAAGMTPEQVYHELRLRLP
jgi:hypothetical protein